MIWFDTALDTFGLDISYEELKPKQLKQLSEWFMEFKPKTENEIYT